jgi:ATP-dependent DNA helicase RecQ
VLALTATATPDIADDILKQLSMQNAILINTGIERENLVLEVWPTVNKQVKRERLLELLRSTKGSAIVYCATIRLTTDVWNFLRENGIAATRYHGKLKPKERQEAQAQFMSGECPVMVATKAFGMGIDKADIRLVVHYNFPDSLESYYQEVGRAGRDDKLARGVLLYRLEDRRIQNYFLRGKYPTRELSLRIYDMIKLLTAEARVVTMKDLFATAGLPRRRIKVIVALLESANIVQRTGRGIRKLKDFDTPEDLDAFLRAYEQRHLSDSERLQMMMRYAQSGECRMRFLRQYFAEAAELDCGRCDNCTAHQRGDLEDALSVVPPAEGVQLATGEIVPIDSPVIAAVMGNGIFSAGQKVRHCSFGIGEVKEDMGDKVVVEFVTRHKTMTVRAEYLKIA